MKCPLCNSEITTLLKASEYGTYRKCHTCGAIYEVKEKTEVKI